jgi:NAD(P)-dependent dehydrogenase (short-subunit alcohol dehydrogenase family)
MPETVLIIGASRGLGHEFARQYTARGTRVIGTVRKAEDAEKLRALGAQVHMLDVTREEDHQRVAEQLRLAAETPDILIYNAGVNAGEAHTLETAPLSVWRPLFEVNLYGAVSAARHFLPLLPANKGARGVFITSELGSIHHSTGGFLPYRASKAALNMLVKTLSNDENKRGVCLIALHPGWVKTDMGGPQAPLTPDISIRSMIGTIGRLEIAKHQGAYLSYDGGALPW